MIRNVVMVKLRDDHDRAAVDAIIEQLSALDCRGTVAYTVGRDLGLREDGWSFAIVADFVDEGSYGAYDLDAEHNRLRAELHPHVEAIARVQFEVTKRD